MVEQYVAGIDTGGSSTKAAVYTLDGTLKGLGSASYKPEQPSLGVAEYNPDHILSAVELSLRQAIRDSGVNPNQVLAITTDAMVSGAVGLDEHGHATTPYTTTLDTRFNTELEAMVRNHERTIRQSVGSGTPVVAAKIAWYRRSDPEAYARTQVFVTAGGLVGAHLAGLGADEAFIDPTVLWAVGLSDTRSRSWNKELAALLDVPTRVLPRIVDSTTVIGGLSSDVARRTGFRAGTPIVAGCGDQMAGFLGANVIGDGTVGDSAGTYEVVGRGVRSFLPDPDGLFDLVPSAVGANYVQQAVIAVGGGFTRSWFESNIANAWTVGHELDLDSLAAEVPPGSDGAVFVPHLGGQSSPSRPWVRGGWLGLEWSHHKGHLARSMMEAMAYEVAMTVDAMDSHDRPAKRIVGYGGGTRSDVANQIKADVSGLPYSSLGDIAPAVRAAALLGAVAVGSLDDLSSVAARTATVERTFLPDAKRTSTYSSHRAEYAQAVDLAAQFRRPR
jgi:xylulokinase